MNKVLNLIVPVYWGLLLIFYLLFYFQVIFSIKKSKE